MNRKPVFSGIEHLPRGQASDKLCSGCIVLEGGAFRGVYTSGVLDALMEADINMQCTIGVSAGALNGMNYVSGQIGRSARINLQFRRDPRYVGIHAYRSNRGIIGFNFVLDEYDKSDPLNREAFDREDRRLVAVATNCLTGRPEYFEKGLCQDILKGVQASASMPYVSRPVTVDGIPCLDGGCSLNIPFRWALDEGYEKIVVVRTRPASFRKRENGRASAIARRFYKSSPALAQAIAGSDARYNRECDELEKLKEEGRIYVIGPSSSSTVSRLEKDMEKLGEFYYLGYSDGQSHLDSLLDYLKS